MLEKIKSFYEKNKFEIVVIGGATLLVVGTVLLTRRFMLNHESILDPRVSHIWFNDIGNRSSLEEVKTILEKSEVFTKHSFAIVHNAGEVDKFICLDLSK